MTLTTKKPSQHRLRSGRTSEAGQIYLVTTTTFRRMPYFSEWEASSFTSAIINAGGLWLPDARVLCWVLMPDHWHGLVELNVDGDLSRVMQRAKGRTARLFGVRFPGRGKLWANAFHDCGIRRQDDLLRAARYLVANPMRAGLVRRVGDYPFWNAVWL